MTPYTYTYIRITVITPYVTSMPYEHTAPYLHSQPTSAYSVANYTSLSMRATIGGTRKHPGGCLLVISGVAFSSCPRVLRLFIIFETTKQFWVAYFQDYRAVLG